MTALAEIEIRALPPERFRSILGDRFEEVEPDIERARELLAGRVIWHINSTARGGGVAEMLRSYLAYARGVGVDVRWVVVGGDPGFFAVTKRLHNNLHGDPGDGGEMGPAQSRTYEAALEEGAAALAELVSPGDVVFLHDPQTAGLAPGLRPLGVAVVWRCHVGVDGHNALVRRGWDFLRRYLADVDALIFSRREFIWDGFEDRRIWIMPPTIDAFSPKNQEMGADVVASILGTIGLAEDGSPATPGFTLDDGSAATVGRRANIVQEAPLPPGVPVVAQVSRWDRLKDPIGVLRCFAESVSGGDAHLVLAGPDVEAVTDDPEGREVLGEVRSAYAGLAAGARERVHLVSLPMDDLDENAAMVNAIQRRADIVLQKSIAEGFGLTVAEAMWKARPVVAGRVGGIQDQIVDGESGVLVEDPRDLEAVGRAIDGLLADPRRAQQIGDAARERVIDHFLQINRLREYLEHVLGVMPR